MITIDPDDLEMKDLIQNVKEALAAHAAAHVAHDPYEPSLYAYCKTHDALQEAKKRVTAAYASLGRLVYVSL